MLHFFLTSLLDWLREQIHRPIKMWPENSANGSFLILSFFETQKVRLLVQHVLPFHLAWVFCIHQETHWDWSVLSWPLTWSVLSWPLTMVAIEKHSWIGQFCHVICLICPIFLQRKLSQSIKIGWDFEKNFCELLPNFH